MPAVPSQSLSREESTSNTSDGINKGHDDMIPRIPLDLRNHKTAIGIAFTTMILLSGILPVVLYYGIVYGAGSTELIAIAVSGAAFGAYSLFAMVMRFWSLLRPDSTTKPIGAERRHLDFFQLNFITLFIALTALITPASVIAGSDNPSTRILALRLYSTNLPILMIVVCIQMALVFTAMSFTSRLRYPFRISSMAKGDLIRPAAFTIVEDVVAVDGKQGTVFRHTFGERYQSSEEVRALLKWADAVWGFSGVAVGVALVIIIWAVENVNVGFVLGWIVPWIWAGLFAIITTKRTQAALRKENGRSRL